MNEHKNIITIEDEIKEFSDKPVKSSALYKKVKELEANAVPDASEASVGDVLSLDEDKKPTWSAPSGGLPDPSEANVGDALVLNEHKEPTWGEAGGYKVISTPTNVNIIPEQTIVNWQTQMGVYIGGYEADSRYFTYPDIPESLIIKYDGVDYTCHAEASTIIGLHYGGNFDGTTFDFSEYPFVVMPSNANYGTIVAQTSGNHSINAIGVVNIETIEITSNFQKAVSIADGTNWEPDVILHTSDYESIDEDWQTVQSLFPISQSLVSLRVDIIDANTNEIYEHCVVKTWSEVSGTLYSLTLITDCFHPSLKFMIGFDNLKATLLHKDGYLEVEPHTYKITSTGTEFKSYTTPVLFELVEQGG